MQYFYTILADDQLIVGTKQGYLLVYKLVPKRNPETQRIEKFDVSIIRSNKNFSKKPITQIEALPDFEIFLSLSDNQVSVHSLTEYSSALTCSLLSSKSRGALMFVTNVTRYKGLTGDRTPVLRLCVALKRKLLIFYWKNGDFHELAPDLSIPDVPKSISWVGESLFVGFRGEYTLIKVTGEQKELFAVGKHPEPMVAAIENHKLLALGRDDKTYILDNEGKPVLSYDISWSDIPQCMTDDPPYLLCLLPNSSVEIQTMEPRISIQKIAMDTSLSSAALKVKRILSCVNRPGHIFAFSSSDILCLVAIPLQQQISQMLKENHFDLAKKLADLTRRDSTSSSSREDSGQFHQTESDQEDTIKKIDQLHAYHLFCKKEFKESMNLFSKLDTDPVVVINLFPDLIPVSSRSKIDYPSPLPTLNAQELKAGLTALIDFLLPVRRNLAAKDSKPVGSTLAKNRPHLRQIVDTTLLKCYLHTSDALVASLLRLPDNNCHVEESEEALLKFNKLNELIILYQSKGMHRKALDMLTSHCRVSQLKKETDSPSTSPSRGFSHDRVIKYLQHLGPDQLDLIFEYSEWIIREHPEDGLRIFTEDFGSDTEHLPRQKVVEFFERINPTLTIPYLEHVIENWKDTSPTLHNLLLYKYRERVTHLLPEYLHSLPEGHSPASPGQEPGELGIMRGKLLKLLQDSSCYSTEVLPAHFLKDGLWDERAVVMGKIGEHREALSIYICQLNDADKAENYCRRVYETSSSPGSKEVRALDT